MRGAPRHVTSATGSGGACTTCSRPGRCRVVRGVIFDLDGVIADTERLQWQAYRRVLGEYGVDVGLEEYRRHWIAGGFGPDYPCPAYSPPICPLELQGRAAPPYSALPRGRLAPCPRPRQA